MSGKITLAIVANNYGRDFDGIGKHAYILRGGFPDWIDADVYTSECVPYSSRLYRLLCPGMTLCLFRLCSDLKKSRRDAVMIDYPFVECNPLVIIPVMLIRSRLRRTGGRLILSLHEYDRVGRLRKFVIRSMLRGADMVFVSGEKLGRSVSRFTKGKIVTRPVTANMRLPAYSPDVREPVKGRIVFFGLVNRSKAFAPMLEAWDLYCGERETPGQLVILSGTSGLGNTERKNGSVVYRCGLDDGAVYGILRESAFCVTPIIPEVDEKNSSFKAACMSGCICLGHFCEEYRDLPFTEHIERYTAEGFLEAFRKIEGYAPEVIGEKRRAAAEFGKRFDPVVSAACVADEIRRFTEGQG